MSMSPRLLRPAGSGLRYASLRQGLVAYWPLNETAASGDVTAEDKSGRGNNLTSNNSVLSTTGKIGNARQFVRSNSEYLSGSSADYALGETAWSIALWFFVPTAASNSHFILAAKDENGARQFAVNYNLTVAGATSANALTFTGYSSGQGGLNIGFTGLSRNEWHLLTVTHAINSVDIVVTLDNTSTVTATRTGGVWTTFSSPLNIGRRAFSAFHEYADASIDEFAIWSRALSSGELGTLWNSGAGIDLRQ
jgi:hypothetical protein